MRRGRPKAPLTLTDDERETLERWTRRPTTAQALTQRARIVLACVSGRDRDNSAVAVEARVTRQTVGRWRHRFVAKRVAGLLDEPRPGAPRKITDEHVEQVVRLTLENTPRDATHWSTRAMARRCGLSQSAVSRIWRAFAWQPHRVETFKLSKDPRFIEKGRDIVGLYRSPPTRRWSCASTRRRRSRRSIAASRSCRCGRDGSSGARTITRATARRRWLPL
jgi:transposase